jgi:hypothetical protein
MTTTCNKRTQPTHKRTTHRSENSTPPPATGINQTKRPESTKGTCSEHDGQYITLCMSLLGEWRPPMQLQARRYRRQDAEIFTNSRPCDTYRGSSHTRQFTPPLRRCSASPREGFWCRGAGDSYISLRSDRIRRFRPCASRQPHRTDSAPHANREIRTPT